MTDSNNILAQWPLNIPITWVFSEADLGLVKLVVMTNIFFNDHQHQIEIKRLICVK